MTEYIALANAIVEQAVKDYRTAMKRQNNHDLKELERFFRSGWFHELTRVDGVALMTKIREVAA